MKGGLLQAGVGVALLMVSGVAPVLAQDDTFEWNGRLEAGQVLEVKGIVGSIRALPASGSMARVEGEKTGRRSDFDEVRVEVVENRNGVTICVLYDWRNRDQEGCDYEDHDDRNDHRRGNRSIDVGVDFVVRVPAGVEFVGTTVTGDVEAEDLRSDVTATSVTGDVVVSTSEVAWATTVSGNLDIEMGSTDWDDLAFHTVSGDITLRLPAGLDASVDFESLTGDLDSDFDMTRTDRRERRWVGSRVRGTIGEGGRSLSLNTVSGDVQLLRRR